MKQFLITLAAVLIGGFLALLGYDHFIVKPREAGAVKTAAEMPKGVPAQVDLSQARAEAKQVADDVEASVQRSVDSVREAMQMQAKDADRRAMVAEAVSKATMFRVSITEYYQTQGRWPRDADDAGLPTPEDMRSPGVTSIAIGEQGAVVVALDGTLAANSKIVLRPIVKASTGMVEWRCELMGDSSLKAMLPRCEMTQ
jgi:Pilin (bacterial filament)